MILYLGVRREVFAQAQANTNYWLFPSDDVEAEYTEVSAGGFSTQPCIYVTLSSLKDPDHAIAPHGVMNLQVMAMAPSSKEAWGVAESEADYTESAGYQAVKAQQRSLLLSRVEQVFPGLTAGVVYSEMATPLTHARYTLSSNGTSYGIACTPEQMLFKRPAPQTEIKGLVLAGASTRSAHGVMGAILSGREAARAVVRALQVAPARGEKQQSLRLATVRPARGT
jgi:phytoene dehydrogenase-like protein